MSPSPLPSNASRSGDPSPPLSINQLALNHCRERLFVHPLFWTNRQLELLQCSFNDPCPAPPLTSIHFTGELSGLPFVVRLFKRQQMLDRERSILDILAHSECPLIDRKNLPFYFNGRGRVILHCASLFLRGKPDARSHPIAAYIDEQHLQLFRSEALEPKVPRRQGRRTAARIAYAIHKLRLKSITPIEPLRDPYIVALLIAVAQEQYQQALERSGDSQQDCPRTFPSQVLFSSPKRECLHLYTADISSAFLDKLMTPAFPPSTETSVSIQVTVIPYVPGRSLRDRLLALVLPPQNRCKGHSHNNRE
ncbi:hypothetical protein HIM_06201 [Hirsutella minnesotensis 3608]|uniref:Uncharacterized protein n=1 Tax=Hirsutella minnesotensis 3608 TaxID=1043627 RepID=A0A0F7ZJG9_9HYPO|nr:hypothetical protein HIM_06201 [Hirsutella minnesotensis 3608]